MSIAASRAIIARVDWLETKPVRITFSCTSALALVIACSAASAMGTGMGSGASRPSTGYGDASGGPSMSSDDYTIAVRLIRHKQYADAIPHLQMALADKPHDADILNYLGYTKRMVGEYDASLDYYQRALQIDPSHKGVHEYLGELYLQKNDLASAQKELATLATLCPSGCDEKDVLTKAIADYKPGSTTAAVPATATTASTAASSGAATPGSAAPASTQP